MVHLPVPLHLEQSLLLYPHPEPLQYEHRPGESWQPPQGTQTCTGPCCSTTIVVVLLPELVLLELLLFEEDDELDEGKEPEVVNEEAVSKLFKRGLYVRLDEGICAKRPSLLL